MFRHVLLYIFIFFVRVAVGGQNPFDMQHRLPQVSVATTEQLHRQPINPFDVMPHVAPGRDTEFLQKRTQRKALWLHRILQVKGAGVTKPIIFWMLVVVVGYLAFSIAANRTVVGKAWRGFLNNNSLAIAHRESLLHSGALPYLLLYINFIINAGIFIFLAVRAFKGEAYSNLTFLMLCTVLVGGIFIIKHAVLRVTGWLYPVLAEINRYNFTIVIFNCVLGLFLLPFNFLIAYVGDFQQFLVFWLIGLVIIFYIYRTFRALMIVSKWMVNHVFHFLLYLCTVEIAPILIVLKIAMS